MQKTKFWDDEFVTQKNTKQKMRIFCPQLCIQNIIHKIVQNILNLELNCLRVGRF